MESRAKTGLVGRENKVKFQKKSRRDRMMRSKSFEAQEVIEIGRKKGFSILWMRITKIPNERNVKSRKD